MEENIWDRVEEISYTSLLEENEHIAPVEENPKEDTDDEAMSVDEFLHKLHDEDQRARGTLL